MQTRNERIKAPSFASHSKKEAEGTAAFGVGDIRASLPSTYGFTPMEVEGQLPSSLNGTLFRNGPGSAERFGHVYEHIFHGDGAISAVRFEGGQAEGAVRYVETPAYLEEEAQGRLLYGDGVSWLRRMFNTARGRRKQPMNVNVVHWQGRLFALSDGATPFAIDPVTLAGLGEEDFEGLVVGAHSAHPHWLASRKTLYNFSMIYGQQTEVEVYAFPLEGKPYKVARVPVKGITYVHDFIVTDRHIVFFLSPVRVNVWRSLLQLGGLGDLLQWRPEEGTEVLVIPLDAPERSVSFETEPFFQWHFANAFEREGEVVVDYVRHRDFATLSVIHDKEQEERPERPEQSLHRAFVDPQARRFRSVPLWDQSCEFPGVTERARGTDARYLWMVGAQNDERGLVKFDTHTEQATHVPVMPGQEVSEPIFVPEASPESEDDGHVLMLTYDAPSHRSFVGVYDGKEPSQGPIARVWFEHHIPTTFHGTWMSAQQS